MSNSNIFENYTLSSRDVREKLTPESTLAIVQQASRRIITDTNYLEAYIAGRTAVEDIRDKLEPDLLVRCLGIPHLNEKALDAIRQARCIKTGGIIEGAVRLDMLDDTDQRHYDNSTTQMIARNIEEQLEERVFRDSGLVIAGTASGILVVDYATESDGTDPVAEEHGIDYVANALVKYLDACVLAAVLDRPVGCYEVLNVDLESHDEIRKMYYKLEQELGRDIARKHFLGFAFDFANEQSNKLERTYHSKEDDITGQSSESPRITRAVMAAASGMRFNDWILERTKSEDLPEPENEIDRLASVADMDMAELTVDIATGYLSEAFPGLRGLQGLVHRNIDIN